MPGIKLINEISHGTTENFPLYVKQIEKQVDTDLHKHDFIELVLILSGHGDHELGETSQSVRTGDVFVIPRNCCHRYKNSSHDLSVINILFIPEFLSLPLLDVTLLPGYEALYLGKNECSDDPYPFFHVEDEDFSFLRRLAIELNFESETRSSGYRFNMLGIFMILLGRLARICSQIYGSNKKNYRPTADVISYLNRHFKKKINIVKLCSIAGMSKASLMRNFARTTGTTPLQYQMRLRITEAIILVRSTDKRLSEIAFETGFSDSHYFGRQFKQITGYSPGEYRKTIFSDYCGVM